MLARLGKARPALVHHVVVGERDDLDAVGLQRVDQGNRRVEEEWLGAVRVRWSHGRLQIHKAEVRPFEDVGNLGEERAPAHRARSGGRGGGAHRLMRNHVAGHGKADLRQFVRIRRNRRRGAPE